MAEIAEKHTHMSSFTHMLGLSVAAIAGYITANYLNLSSQYGSLAETGAGLVIFGVPIFLLKEKGLAYSMVRLYLGVLGLTMILRGVFGNGTVAGLINVPLPNQISNAI